MLPRPLGRAQPTVPDTSHVPRGSPWSQPSQDLLPRQTGVSSQSDTPGFLWPTSGSGWSNVRAALLTLGQLLRVADIPLRSQKWLGQEDPVNVLGESDWTLSLVGNTRATAPMAAQQRPPQEKQRNARDTRETPGTDSRQEDQRGGEGPRAESEARSRTRDRQEACPPSPASCRRLSWSCPGARGWRSKSG